MAFRMFKTLSSSVAAALVLPFEGKGTSCARAALFLGITFVYLLLLSGAGLMTLLFFLCPFFGHGRGTGL